jgi:hypothetical protein
MPPSVPGLDPSVQVIAGNNEPDPFDFPKKLGKSLDKLKSPTLEKALVFLDDKLLGATSNAVERANRRFRKAQKSIYSVRTKEHVEQRLALDMQREQRTPERQQTVKTLRRARSKPT